MARGNSPRRVYNLARHTSRLVRPDKQMLLGSLIRCDNSQHTIIAMIQLCHTSLQRPCSYI